MGTSGGFEVSGLIDAWEECKRANADKTKTVTVRFSIELVFNQGSQVPPVSRTSQPDYSLINLK